MSKIITGVTPKPIDPQTSLATVNPEPPSIFYWCSQTFDYYAGDDTEKGKCDVMPVSGDVHRRTHAASARMRSSGNVL